jgi:hypothetical protein
MNDRAVYGALRTRMFALFLLALLSAPAWCSIESIETWLATTPTSVIRDCPWPVPVQQQAPGYKFPDPAFPYFPMPYDPDHAYPSSCQQDGPYTYDGKPWFVMRVKGYLAGKDKEVIDKRDNKVLCKPAPGKRCRVSMVRVCSKDAEHTGELSLLRSPCALNYLDHHLEGVGPRGCSVCAFSAEPQ